MSERWWIAEKPGVTFAFSTRNGIVDKVAPIGRKWMKGRTVDEVGVRLLRNGYTVKSLRS